MHYYQFNIGDYIKQTAHLTPLEDICYRRLLDMYYETEQPIPIETKRVSRRLRLDTETVETVLNEFFELTENGWESARCNREIKAYKGKAATARLNGKLGGRPPKTQSVIHRNPEETGSKAKHKPLTIKQEPLNNKQDKDIPAPVDTGFDRFWSAYPRRTGKAEALKSWLKLQPDEDLQERIINHINLRVTALDWVDVKFIPHPATFINGERWNDEIIDNRGSNNGKHGQTGRKLSIADEIRGQARAHIEKLDREHREANSGAICQDGSIVQIEGGGLSDNGW